MNLKQLETFVWIARLGGFSAAARRLNATQPTISMRIQGLEKSLGVRLFERAGRAVWLTPKGREFAAYAEKIVDLSREAHQRLGDHKSLSGRVRMGVTETIALTWLPRLVTRVNAAFSAVVVDLDVDLTSGLWHKLGAGELDLALLPGPVRDAHVVAGYLGSTLYTWMASPRLGLPRRRLTPKDLEASPIITLSSDSNLHEIIENWFHDNAAEPHRIVVCNSLGVVAALTVSRLGVSLLSPEIFREEIARGELVILDIAPRIEPFEFLYVYPHRGDSPLAPVIADLAREISTFAFAGKRATPSALADL